MKKLSNYLTGLLLLVMFACVGTKTTSKTSLTVSENTQATVRLALKHITTNSFVVVSDNTVKTTNELVTTYYKVDSATKKAEPVKQTIERKITEAVNKHETNRTAVNQSDSIYKRSEEKSSLKGQSTSKQSAKPYVLRSIKLAIIIFAIVLIVGYFIYKRFF